MRDVGDVAADPVAGAHAEAAQLGGEGADLGAQLGPGDGGGVVGLVHVQQGGRVGAGRVLGGTQRVLRVIEGGAGEPAGAGHRGVGEDRLVRRVEADVEPGGDGLPETGQFGHGPVVQRGVVRPRVACGAGGGAVVGGRPVVEPGELGAGDAVRAGLPQGFRLRVGLRCGGHDRLPAVRGVAWTRCGRAVRGVRGPRTAEGVAPAQRGGACG